MDEMNYEIDADSYYDSPEEFFTDLSLENDDFCDCCRKVLPHFPSFKEWKLGKPHGDLIGYKFDPLQFCQSDEEASLFRERKEEVLIPKTQSSVLHWLTIGDQSICRKPGNSKDTTTSSG